MATEPGVTITSKRDELYQQAEAMKAAPKPKEEATMTQPTEPEQPKTRNRNGRPGPRYLYYYDQAEFALLSGLYHALIDIHRAAVDACRANGHPCPKEPSTLRHYWQAHKVAYPCLAKDQRARRAGESSRTGKSAKAETSAPARAEPSPRYKVAEPEPRKFEVVDADGMDRVCLCADKGRAEAIAAALNVGAETALQAELDRAREAIRKLSDDWGEMRGRCQKAESELARMTEMFDRSAREGERIMAGNMKALDELKTAKDELAEANAKIETLHRNYAEATAGHGRAIAEIQTMRKACDDAPSEATIARIKLPVGLPTMAAIAQGVLDTVNFSCDARVVQRGQWLDVEVGQ
jgi:hypothetical protein